MKTRLRDKGSAKAVVEDVACSYRQCFVIFQRALLKASLQKQLLRPLFSARPRILESEIWLVPKPGEAERTHRVSPGHLPTISSPHLHNPPLLRSPTLALRKRLGKFIKKFATVRSSSWAFLSSSHSFQEFWPHLELRRSPQHSHHHRHRRQDVVDNPSPCPTLKPQRIRRGASISSNDLSMN